MDFVTIISFIAGVFSYFVGKYFLKKYLLNVDKKENEWKEAVREQCIKNIKKQYYLTPKGEHKNVD